MNGCYVLDRTNVLRIAFVASLLAAAVICGVISYNQLNDLETSVGVHTYESIAELALDGAETNMLRRLQGGGVMAQVMSFSFPNASQWPYVSFDGYTEINRNVGKMSTSTEHSLIPIVRPEQLADFEAFAKKTYQDHGYPETVGINDFGFGIWHFDPNPANPQYPDMRVHDTTGETTWGSPHKILTPVLHVGHKNGGYELINGHYGPFFGGAHDSLIDCALARQERAQQEDHDNRW